VSYESIAQAAQDTVLRSRIAACVAQEDHGSRGHPLAVTDMIQWQVCSEPGWGEAWESAVAGGVPVPGADQTVIPDAWILTAVQKYLGQSPGVGQQPVGDSGG
jgi:hypothetical protein